MSNKLSNGFCGKLTALAMLAASLSLSALPGALAQSMGSSSGDTSSSSAANSAATTSASTSAPLPGDSSSSATSSTSTTAPAAGDSTTTTSTTTTTAAPTSDIPPGVLWTDPKYAVKEVAVPTRVAVPSGPRPTTGTTSTSTTTKTTTTTATEAANLGYDDKAAQSFADSVGSPQLVWTRPDPATKSHQAAAQTAAKEMAAYDRALVEKFVANMTVPTSATLVENTKNEYLYLLNFTIDDKGKITRITPVTSYGKLNALTLADDNENRMMYASMTQALAKCSPVKVPKLGFAPWYMLLKYEPNTGKVFVTNVNGI